MRSTPHILLAALLATALAAGETRVRVTADRANLRFQNADSLEVAGVVSAGQELVVRGPLEGVWVPVVPPDGISAWVYAELVRKGQVVRDKTQIRSGPGLSSRVVCSLDQGAVVEPRGRLGDWMKIRLPPSLPLWISRSAVTVSSTATVSEAAIALPPVVASGLLSALTDETNAAVAATGVVAAAVSPPPVVLSQAVATAAVVHAPLPVELAGLAPAPQPLQGRQMRFAGTLRPRIDGATVTPARFRVTGRDRSGGLVTFCHVLGSEVQLAPADGRSVIIEGPTWWLKGDPVPVVKAEKLVVEK